MAITPITKKREIYSDFRMDFLLSPVNDDLARKNNEEAVKESIRNLLLTDRGERLFQPLLGGNIRQFLFENITPATLIMIREAVRDTIKNFEPRCSLIDVDVITNNDKNYVTIVVTFYIINIETPVTLNVTLDRVR